ncbi:MAG: hypothetical protein WAN48_10710 [Actinomycetes bacterium]
MPTTSGYVLTHRDVLAVIERQRRSDRIRWYAGLVAETAVLLFVFAVVIFFAGLAS